MKFKSILGLLICAILPAVSHAAGEGRVVTRTVNPDDVVFLAGLGAMIESDSAGLFVGMLPPAEHRAKAYGDVDLLRNDRVLMCNGKRVKTAVDLRGLIDALKIGDEIKLGIKRGEDLMIRSFPKADPETSGGPMIMMTQEVSTDGKGVKKTMRLGGGPGAVEGTVVVLDCGLILGPSGDEVVVIAVMPRANELIEGEVPAKGDRILSVNGKIDTNMQALQELYDGFGDGDKITLEFERDGQKYSSTYVKAPLQQSGAAVIKRD